MKKVLYVIFNSSHGKGGHFYSLKTTSEGLSKNKIIDATIVVIGVRPSPIFNERDENIYFIKFSGYNFLSTLRKLKNIIKYNNIDFLHSFDLHAYLFTRLINLYYSLPMLVTKCGGKNLKYTPYINNFILYSTENILYIRQQRKFSNSNLYLIPNRVNYINEDKLRIYQLLNKYSINSNNMVFLRISRFVNGYEESMIQSINLKRKLEHLNAQLIIIGEIQEEEVYDRISKYVDNEKNIFLITDAIYTKNASELINIADCVIGTGRGLMEASSYNKILFTPLNGYNLPVLVDEGNVQSLIDTNFSPRNKLDNYSEVHNLDKILELISSKDKRLKYNSFSKNLFNKKFDINSSMNKYHTLYNLTANYLSVKLFDLLLHTLYFIRFYYISKRKFK